MVRQFHARESREVLGMQLSGVGKIPLNERGKIAPTESGQLLLLVPIAGNSVVEIEPIDVQNPTHGEIIALIISWYYPATWPF